jgi:hypothetical protein
MWDTVAVRTAAVQLGGYWTRGKWRAVHSRWAQPTKSHRLMTCERWYACDTLLKRLAKTPRTWRRHARSSSQKSAPWCARDTSPGCDTCPPPISPTSEMG